MRILNTLPCGAHRIESLASKKPPDQLQKNAPKTPYRPLFYQKPYPDSKNIRSFAERRAALGRCLRSLRDLSFSGRCATQFQRKPAASQFQGIPSGFLFQAQPRLLAQQSNPQDKKRLLAQQFNPQDKKRLLAQQFNPQEKKNINSKIVTSQERKF